MRIKLKHNKLIKNIRTYFSWFEKNNIGLTRPIHVNDNKRE